MSWISCPPSSGPAATPGGANTNVQYNNAGTFGGNAQFVYDGAGTVGFDNLTGTALALTIKPLAPTVLDAPGNLNLSAQNSLSSSFNGGNVAITSGNGSGSSNAGAITLQGGNSVAGGGYGGTIQINAGAGSVFGGGVVIQAGTGLSTGGVVNIIAGTGVVSTGRVNISNQSSQVGLAVGTVGGFGGALGVSAFGVALSARPTVAIAGGVFVANVGVPVMDTSTFDGYTIPQIAAALRQLGWLT